MVPKILLACGILSAVLYVGTDLLSSLIYEGYSFRDQAVSELSAIGAPTRSLVGTSGLIYSALLLAFGVGVWKTTEKRGLKIAGILVAVHGTVGLVAWPLAPMHRREVLAGTGGTWTDTLHIVLTAVTVLLILAEIGFGTAAFGKRFRIYSIASFAVILAFGLWTSLDAPRINEGLSTPWFGIKERVSVYGYMLWILVLSAGMLRNKEAGTLQS